MHAWAWHADNGEIRMHGKPTISKTSYNYYNDSMPEHALRMASLCGGRTSLQDGDPVLTCRLPVKVL